MGVVVLPKSLTAKTPARAADVMADLNAVTAQVNGKLDLENFAESLRNALIPTGTILATARGSAPTGFLLCQGQAVSRTTYAVLFAAIGTSFGPGDGVTTFNLPDLRGRAAVGVDAGAGRLNFANKLGEGAGQDKLRAHKHFINNKITGFANKDHSHNVDMAPSTRHEGDGFAYDVMGYTPGLGLTNTGKQGSDHTHNLIADTDLTGSGAEDGTQMPPFQSVNYMIKI